MENKIYEKLPELILGARSVLNELVKSLAEELKDEHPAVVSGAILLSLIDVYKNVSDWSISGVDWMDNEKKFVLALNQVRTRLECSYGIKHNKPLEMTKEYVEFLVFREKQYQEFLLRMKN